MGMQIPSLSADFLAKAPRKVAHVARNPSTRILTKRPCIAAETPLRNTRYRLHTTQKWTVAFLIRQAVTVRR